MPDPNRQLVYASGDCEVDLGRRELRTHGVPVPIGGRAFELFEVLVRSAGQLVTKDDLIDRVWPGAIVNDNTIQVHIAAVRKALGAQRTVLRTESGRGYRLVGEWTVRQDASRPPPLISPPEPREQGERPTTNFPPIITRLIGRGAAAERLHDMLSAYRVVTLTGPGGIGKTTLALQVARAQLDNFGGGWLVELAALTHLAQVPNAVAGVLGLNFGHEAVSAEAVARAIGGARFLLLLDNCEHLIDAVAELAEAIVTLCPHVTILVTSREILRVEGECVYRVPPLDVPPPDAAVPERLADHSSVALFIARTKALDSEFVADAQTLTAVAEICRRLDGIPLAIEFAAARAATLGVAHVALGLEDRFDLLTSGRRTALPRHRTLRAALDWSYDLLPSDEAEVLRRLSVFAGCFSFDAALAVASCDDLSQTQSVEAIANLVAKSLVTTDSGARGVRYRLLDTIRAYAADKLAEQGDGEKAASHHAGFFHDALVRICAEETDAAVAEGFAAYVDQVANVRAALEWSFSPRGNRTIAIGLAAVASQYFLDLSLLTECLRWTEQAIEILDEASAGTRREMELRASLGLSLMFTRGNTEAVSTALLRAVELAEVLGVRQRQLQILRGLHIYATRIGDFRGALDVSRRSQVVAKILNDPSGMAMADWMLGVAQHLAGDQAGAVAHCQSAMRHADYRHGNLARIGFDHRIVALVALARGLWLRGQPEQAVDVARYAVKEAEPLDHPLSLCIAMIWTVYVFLWIGDWPNAEEIIERLIALTTRYSLGPYQSVGLGLKGQLLAARGQLAGGIPLLRRHLETLREARHQILTTVFATALAEALARSGEAEEALALIDEAIAQIGTAETFDRPEVFRTKGTVLISISPLDAAEAERWLQRAIKEAHEQSALGWELRAATDLARLWQKLGRTTEARDLLAPVYAQFNEGAETADIKAARTLLETLST